MDATTATVDTSFSTLLRAASLEEHKRVSTSPFMNDLLGGRHGVDAFARYTEQLWYVYRALEETAETLKDSPATGPFIQPRLFRTESLERDLAHLLGEEWRERSAPLPETRAYAERIQECARTWAGGYIAHHYTRYLGDLAGGQAVRSRAERNWGITHKGDGVRFYIFDGIASPPVFRREYRELLDAVTADELEQQRVVAECVRAYGFNEAILVALAAEFPDRKSVV